MDSVPGATDLLETAERKQREMIASECCDQDLDDMREIIRLLRIVKSLESQH